MRVLIRRWGAKGRQGALDVGGLEHDALVAIVDDVQNGTVRVIDVLTERDYWLPVEVAVRVGSRKTTIADVAEGMRQIRFRDPSAQLTGKLSSKGGSK